LKCVAIVSGLIHLLVDWPSGMDFSFHGKLNDDIVLFFLVLVIFFLSYAELSKFILASKVEREE